MAIPRNRIKEIVFWQFRYFILLIIQLHYENFNVTQLYSILLIFKIHKTDGFYLGLSFNSLFFNYFNTDNAKFYYFCYYRCKIFIHGGYNLKIAWISHYLNEVYHSMISSILLFFFYEINTTL